METGIFYDSVTLAAKSAGIAKSTLIHWLLGTYPNKSRFAYS